MTPLIGVSSSSVPHASAPELLRCAVAVGAGCVDLRAGRGQGWEPGLDLIDETLPVSFVGASATLGRGVPAEPLPRRLMHLLVERGIPLRLFVSPLDGAAPVRQFAADVQRLRGTWGPHLRLAIEPHVPTPTLARLDDVLAQHGVGVVVDTLGLVRLRTPLVEARSFLHRHGVAIQVKGFVYEDGDYRHVPLGSVPSVTAWTAALVCDARVPVTVETRARTPGQDIRALRRAIMRLDATLYAHAPLEVPPCVCVS